MDWLRSSVFGGGGGGIDQQQQLQNGVAADAGEDEPASSGPPSPSPRLRKRSKRDNDGVNDNYDEEDNDDESGNNEDAATGIVGRRINFGSRDNTSDDDDSNKSSSSDRSEEEEEEEEEDVLNTTVDTVENPIVEDVTNEGDDDCSERVGHGGASGGEERVYVNDDAEREHVQMERQHWRDMEWDPDALKFFYKPGFDAQDGIPTAEGYDIIKPTHAGMQVRLVFNLSRDIIMACYEGEVNHLYETLENLGIPKTIEGVGEHLFGAKSRFVQTLARRLKKDERDVHKFLATFFFAAELGLPSKRLEQHPNIKFDKYMDQQDLNSFWRDIASIGKGGGEPTYLWQSVEDSLNADCRDLFLTVGGHKYKLRVALDDDKVHFQFSSISVIKDRNFLCGLSPQQHIKANRRGVTIDSAVSAATGFPLCFRARREGFSSVQNYEAMLRYMFQYKFSVPGAAALALNDIIFCSDRGYWQVGIILLILSFGGSVFGTLMRKEWVPFTYDQRRPGQRLVIETKYGRNIFLAFGRWCRNMLKIMAFRNGTGGVSLAMDSDGIETAPQIWEFCFKDNGDAKWYNSNQLTKQQRKLKAFRSIDGIVTSKKEQSDIDHHLYMLPVTMVTCQDMDFSWATLRKYSFTSSSSEAAIRNAAPHVPPDENVRPAYEAVLKYASLTKHLSDSDDSISVGSNSVDDGESPIDASLVTKVVKSMRAGRTQETLVDSKKDAQRIFMELSTCSSNQDATDCCGSALSHALRSAVPSVNPGSHGI